MRIRSLRYLVSIARGLTGAAIFVAVLMAAPISGDGTRSQTGGEAPKGSSPQSTPANPWTPAQTVEPAALAQEIGGSHPASRPKIACVGFRALYEGGHIPGASYHGPSRTDEGLADLKKWADAFPRSTEVVLYCGCCPLTHCPNLRPAFAALREMGFTHVRALILPTNFATDWADKGYPVEK